LNSETNTFSGLDFTSLAALARLVGNALQRQRLGEADNARLGRGVVGLADLTGETVDGAYIHNPAEPAFAHAAHHRAAGVEAAAEVHVDDVLASAGLADGIVAGSKCDPFKAQLGGWLGPLTVGPNGSEG
jgi:hypothetical protein